MVVELAVQGEGLMAQKQDECWLKSHCGGSVGVLSRGHRRGE